MKWQDAESLTPPLPITWGADDPVRRGPIIASTAIPQQRNVIGAYSGVYSAYFGIAGLSNAPLLRFVPDIDNQLETAPVDTLGTLPGCSSSALCTMDPFGHDVVRVFSELIRSGYDIRPTISITTLSLRMPEIVKATVDGALKPDGRILSASGTVSATAVAIQQVWHLPGVAGRLSVPTDRLRSALYHATGGMYPELVEEGGPTVFVPPIPSTTVLVIGSLARAEAHPIVLRPHDECVISDVFGSDRCTCRPYLCFALEAAVCAAQEGGAGIILYTRKDGRALGEVVKFMVYNARDRQAEGDLSTHYFLRTALVAGASDARCPQLSIDPLRWLGLHRVDQLFSMNSEKLESLVSAGIQVRSTIPLPDSRVSDAARVEIHAKGGVSG